jgi:cytochrome P450
LIGNGVVSLFRFPEQLELLRSTPELDANAVEEVLRFESPAQFTRRLAVAPFEVLGVEIPAGSVVTLGLSAANRDPAKWGPDADRLDIARPHANEQLSFGGGPHFCLGAALARLEAQIALPRLVRRFPRLTLGGEPDWHPRMVLRGLRSLPATVSA